MSIGSCYGVQTWTNSRNAHPKEVEGINFGYFLFKCKNQYVDLKKAFPKDHGEKIPWKIENVYLHWPYYYPRYLLL